MATVQYEGYDVNGREVRGSATVPDSFTSVRDRVRGIMLTSVGTPAVVAEVTAISRLNPGPGDNLRPIPGTHSEAVRRNNRGTFDPSPTPGDRARTAAQSDALSRVLGDSTTVAAQQARGASTPASAGTGNS